MKFLSFQNETASPITTFDFVFSGLILFRKISKFIMKAMKNLIIISSTHQRANSNIVYATQNKDEGDN